MGKRKHNAKGRQVNTVIVDNSETKKVSKPDCEEKMVKSPDSDFV